MLADPVYKYAPNLNSITAQLLEQTQEKIFTVLASTLTVNWMYLKQ